MTPSPLRAVLLRAAELIERDGLVQYRSGNRHLGWCAMAALREADNEHLRDGWQRLSTFLGVGSVVFWNDTPGRTKEQVLAALRGAAESVT